MKKLAVLLAAVMILSGCIPHPELDRIGIAEAVGVDFDGSVYTVTVQFFNTDSTGGITAIDSSAPNVNISRAGGKTIESALEELSHRSGHNIMLGSASVIVFGEGALTDLRDSLDLCVSHYSSNMRAYVCAAEGSAADIMNIRFNEGNASVEKLKEMIGNSRDLGLSRPVILYEAAGKLREPTESAVLPLLRVYGSGSGDTEEGKSIIIRGGALCVCGSLPERLTEAETAGLQLLDPGSDGSGDCRVTITHRSSDIRADMFGIRSRITPSLNGDRLRIDVEISAHCKLVSTSLPDPYAAGTDMERLCGQELSERAYTALETTLKRYGADVVGLSYAIRSQSPEIWETIKDDYGEYLRNSEISVSCSVSAERFGLTG